MRILPFVALIFSALLAACASEISSPLMGGPFADPGKYEFYSCDQIAANRKSVAAQLEKLKLLMDQAEKGTGGRSQCDCLQGRLHRPAADFRHTVSARDRRMAQGRRGNGFAT
jgi:hypothetical protein